MAFPKFPTNLKSNTSANWARRTAPRSQAELVNDIYGRSASRPCPPRGNSVDQCSAAKLQAHLSFACPSHRTYPIGNGQFLLVSKSVVRSLDLLMLH